MKVLLDTSVLFAVFGLEHGFSTDLFRQVILKHGLVISDHILEELRRRLGEKCKLPLSKLDEIETSLLSVAIKVVPASIPADACRDPDDLPVLGAAIAAEAEVLVTGDKELLTLSPFRNIPILTPRQFHDTFLSSG